MIRHEDSPGGIGGVAKLPERQFVANQGYARLGTGYPIEVVYGDKVKITEVKFDWMGPATTLYWCFGLKNDRANFENGLGLEGGTDKFAYQSISVPRSTGSWYSFQSTSMSILLPIQSPMRTGIIYATWAWLSYQPNVIEANAVPIEGGDNFLIHAGTVKIVAQVARLLDCNYVKA